MYLSAGVRAPSVRDAPRRDTLVVGGAGHVVGRTDSPLAHVEALRGVDGEWYPGAKETHPGRHRTTRVRRSPDGR